MATTTRNTLDCAPAGLAATTLLRLMQLTSPALPVGGFSYSEGLEAAVEARLVVDEAQATLWLLDQLHLGLARSELAVAARAFDAWQNHDAQRSRTSTPGCNAPARVPSCASKASRWGARCSPGCAIATLAIVTNRA